MSTGCWDTRRTLSPSYSNIRRTDFTGSGADILLFGDTRTPLLVGVIRFQPAVCAIAHTGMSRNTRISGSFNGVPRTAQSSTVAHLPYQSKAGQTYDILGNLLIKRKPCQASFNHK